MERERSFENHRRRAPGDAPSDGDDLDQQRAEIEGLLRASDHVFDSISSLHAQQYLQQNLQTGGQ